MEKLVALLVLWGCSLSCSSQVQPRNYYYINQRMNWSDAREYCRRHYIDLATIESTYNINRLQPSFPYEKAWIGMWDDPRSWKQGFGSDPNSWRWSATGGLARTSYWGFTHGDPNALYGLDYCAKIIDTGGWYDAPCRDALPFVCQTVGESGKVFTFVPARKTWFHAQQHCRNFFTDLATIENTTETNLALLATRGKPSWIGLFRAPWTWSDRSPVFFHNWQIGQPDNLDSKQFCVAELSDHTWTDEDCNTTMAFICHKNVIKLMTMKIQIKASADLTDPTVYTKVLQQVNIVQTKRGLTNFTVWWRTPPTGQ